MRHDFPQIEWDQALEEHCRQLVRLWVREDLGREHDWTTLALVSDGSTGAAEIVARQAGVICGMAAARVALDEMDITATWFCVLADGTSVDADTSVATLSGSLRDLLTAERLVLNLIGRLSGIATMTRRFVDAVQGTAAEIYDTRKTTPGWRLLEKHAVRTGGGRNHRQGLFDAILIKDNHLARAGKQCAGSLTPAQAVQRAREFVRTALPDQRAGQMLVEVEVDDLAQLDETWSAGPDLILLENMTPAQLRQAVEARDAAGVDVGLEASGGVTLESVRQVAETGVDRISVGALTHSAPSLDVGMDLAYAT